MTITECRLNNPQKFPRVRSPLVAAFLLRVTSGIVQQCVIHRVFISEAIPLVPAAVGCTVRTLR